MALEDRRRVNTVRQADRINQTYIMAPEGDKGELVQGQMT